MLAPQRAGQLLDRALAKFEAVLSAHPDMVPAMRAAGGAYCDLAALLPPDSPYSVLAYQVALVILTRLRFVFWDEWGTSWSCTSLQCLLGPA